MFIRRMLLIALCLALVISVMAGSAAAGRFSVDDQDFRIVWTEVSFVPDFVDPVRCGLTIIGSMHSRTITKTDGLLVGHVTSARTSFPTCTPREEGATALAFTLPWHVTYAVFTGTLPAITGVKLEILGASFDIFTIEDEGIRTALCLARTEASEPGKVTLNVSRGLVTTATFDETAAIDLNDVGASAQCDFIDGSLRGSGTVDDGSGAPIGVSLI